MLISFSSFLLIISPYGYDTVYVQFYIVFFCLTYENIFSLIVFLGPLLTVAWTLNLILLYLSSNQYLKGILPQLLIGFHFAKIGLSTNSKEKTKHWNKNTKYSKWDLYDTKSNYVQSTVKIRQTFRFYLENMTSDLRWPFNATWQCLYVLLLRHLFQLEFFSQTLCVCTCLNLTETRAYHFQTKKSITLVTCVTPHLYFYF